MGMKTIVLSLRDEALEPFCCLSPWNLHVVHISMLKPCHDQYNAIHQIHLYFCQYEVPDLFGFPYFAGLGNEGSEEG